MELKRSSTYTLNNAAEIPVTGTGVFGIPPGEKTRSAVRVAIEYGYTMFDTARVYCNEKGVGRGIADSGVPREKLFITTKLWKTDYLNPRKGLTDSLKRLGLDYVDLFLLHWPFQGYVNAYLELEKLQCEGLCRSIGVSNFKIHHLEELKKSGIALMPQVNQTEVHPLNSETELLQYCKQNGILLQSYSSLGGVGHLVIDDPRLIGICEYYNRTPSQVIIRWGIQRGISVLTKSVHPERLIQNSNVFDFELSSGDMDIIFDMNRNARRNYDPDKIDNRPPELEPKIVEEE